MSFLGNFRALAQRGGSVRRGAAIPVLILCLRSIAVPAATPDPEACTKASDPSQEIALCSQIIDAPGSKAVLSAALDARGKAYLALKKPQLAVADFTRLIALVPGVAGYYDNRQAAYRMLGNLQSALADADRAVALAPNMAFVHHSRATVLAELGRLPAALNDYDAAIAIDPRPGFRYFDRARLLRRMGRYEDARSSLDTAVANGLTPALALKERGLVDLADGLTQRGAGELRAYLAKYPSDQEAADALARLDAPSAAPTSSTPPPNPQTPAVANARRVALVIGNANYQSEGALRNPVHDAEAVAALLRAHGFQTILASDVTHEAFLSALHAFSARSADATVALFYYAGHGAQVDGENYLLPVDADGDNVAMLKLSSLALSDIIGAVGRAKSAVLLLDACRDNPYAKQASRSDARAIAGHRGLAPVSVSTPGLLIAYATAANEVASDGEGLHSPFAAALLKYLVTPGLEVQQVMTRVKAFVVAQTGNAQRPWSSSDLTSDLYLVDSSTP